MFWCVALSFIHQVDLPDANIVLNQIMDVRTRYKKQN